MKTGSGIVSQMFQWIWHPGNSEETLMDWTGFLALAIIVSFLWSTVIRAVD